VRYLAHVKLERGAKIVLVLAGVVVVAAGIKRAQGLLVPFLLAAFIATVTAPLVLWLCGKGVPRGISVLLAVLVDLAAVAGLAGLVGGSINSFYGRVPEYREIFAATVEDLTQWLQARGIRVNPDTLASVAGPADLMGWLAVLLRSVAEVISNLVLVLLIVVFMLFEATGLREKVTRAFMDPKGATRMAAAAQEVNKYLLVKTGTSALTGLLVGLWVGFWGVDLPVLWGLLAFLLNYIPTIGSIVAAVPAVLLAFLQIGAGAAVGVAAGYLAVNFSIGNFFEPRILGRMLGMSSLVVFLSVVLWGWLLGPIGALLSVPLTMIIKIVLENTDDLRWVAVLLEPGGRPRDTVPPAAPEVSVDSPPGRAESSAE
jgi:predicted PurR-regulated permease PerM